MDSIYLGYGWIGAVTAIIAAKWAMKIGFGQVRQLLWAIVAFVLRPLALLALYARLRRQQAPKTTGQCTYAAFDPSASG